MENINLNQKKLSKMIATIDEQNLLNILTQLSVTINSQLNFINNIETSLTFCSMNVLHESIISMKDIREIIGKFKINLDIENFFEASKVLKPLCKLHENILDILIEIPNYKDSENNGVKITPTPIIVNNISILISETTTNLIIEKERVLKLINCLNIQDIDYCKISNEDVSICLNNIMLNQNIKNCSFIKIKFYPPFIVLPNTDIIVAYSVKDNKILIKCNNLSKYLKKGTYKIKNHNCEINNKKVLTFKTKFEEIAIPKISIKLEELKLSKGKEITVHNIHKVEINEINLDEINPSKPSNNSFLNTYVKFILSTLIIIIIIIIVIIIVLTKKFIKKIVIKRKEIELNTLDMNQASVNPRLDF